MGPLYFAFSKTKSSPCKSIVPSYNPTTCILYFMHHLLHSSVKVAKWYTLSLSIKPKMFFAHPQVRLWPHKKVSLKLKSILDKKRISTKSKQSNRRSFEDDCLACHGTYPTILLIIHTFARIVKYQCEDHVIVQRQ